MNKALLLLNCTLVIFLKVQFRSEKEIFLYFSTICSCQYKKKRQVHGQKKDVTEHCWSQPLRIHNNASILGILWKIELEEEVTLDSYRIF